MRKLLAISFLVTTILSVQAQKKPLTFDDFNGWKSISTRTISNNGEYVIWTQKPQEGDVTLFVYSTASGKTTAMQRATSPQFSTNQKYLVFKVVPEYEKVRELKRKKTKKKDMPKNNLVIYDLANAKADTIKEIKSFEMPEEEGNWLVVTFEKEPKETEDVTDEKEELETDGTNEEKEDDKKGKKKKLKGDFVRLIKLGTEQTFDIEHVKSYYLPDYAKKMYYLREEGDSTYLKGLFSLSLESLKPELIDSAFKSCTNISLNKRGTKLVYMTTADSAKADVRYYKLNLWDGKKSATLLDTATAGMPEGWMPSPDLKVTIDEDGKYLLVGTKSIPTIYPKDTMALEEEAVHLDIWHWQDEMIQPMQNKNLNRTKKKAFLGRIDLSSGNFMQLGSDEFEISSFPTDTVQAYLAVSNDKRFRQEMAWLVPTHRDVSIVDVASGKRIAVEENIRTDLSFSPNQKYAYWYNRAAKNWFAFDIANGKKINLSEHLKHPVWNEEWDTPDDPRSYAQVGWVDDTLFVFTDQYDIWAVNPQNTKKTICLTKGEGRNTETEYGFVRLDRERNTLNDAVWLLSTFNDNTKDEGFVQLHWQSGEIKTLINPESSSFGYVTKAKDADKVIFTKGNFQNYPELYVSPTSFTDVKKISETNPQQKDFNWGSVEMVEWKGGNGKKLKGLLYKPEDFDANKKYPMMVYFYETHTDKMNRYLTPSPSASTINIPYFISNGYLVFTPDIMYKTGQPGQDAYDCIVSGAKKLAKESWVDEDRMAIQGQSWGGYQVAYLVTQTNLFKCAMGGAVVSNMTSAYGGIRWSSGMSREFQYERTQSRIGATLWEDRDAYIKNSPVFFADKVETPLLLMHNDEDGAVPWYQGIEYFMALRRLGKPAWLLVYNGEDHNLMKRYNRKDLSIRMSQFFDHYLKDAPAPEWMEVGRKAIEKDTNPAYRLME